MLKKLTVICGLLLAATAAVAWDDMEHVPTAADVKDGTHLAWGDGLVWGLFPTETFEGQGAGITYLFSYYPEEDSWDDSIVPMSGSLLGRTSITYQWKEQPVIFCTGKHEAVSSFDRYFPSSGTWVRDTIDQFGLGRGACIAYAPNDNYNPLTDPVPGWIYCLAGETLGGKTFWKYSIPAMVLPDTALYGCLYPDSGVTIADQTPPFRWSPAMTIQYRIQVSTDPGFSPLDNVIDEVVTSPEYQSAIELPNGTYYWRTATWNSGGSGSWTWPITRNWFVIHGGWEQRDSIINATAGLGAEIAYDDAYFGEPHILALYGREDRCFSRYNIRLNDWVAEDSAPRDIYTGTALTTDAAVVAGTNSVRHIAAVFTGQAEGDHPYGYNKNLDYGWWECSDDNPDSSYNTHLPDDLDYGTSMVIGAAHWMYLTTGQAHDFWGVDPEIAYGQQARDMPSGRVKAQVMGPCDGIMVGYQLPAAAHVRATLHDAVGRQVGTLDLGEQKPGVHRLSWDRDRGGRRLSAGAYFVLLDVGTEQARLKAVVK